MQPVCQCSGTSAVSGDNGCGFRQDHRQFPDGNGNSSFCGGNGIEGLYCVIGIIIQKAYGIFFRHTQYDRRNDPPQQQTSGTQKPAQGFQRHRLVGVGIGGKGFSVSGDRNGQDPHLGAGHGFLPGFGSVGIGRYLHIRGPPYGQSGIRQGCVESVQHRFRPPVSAQYGDFVYGSHNPPMKI